jgi:hypothetical protein
MVLTFNVVVVWVVNLSLASLFLQSVWPSVIVFSVALLKHEVHLFCVTHCVFCEMLFVNIAQRNSSSLSRVPLEFV